MSILGHGVDLVEVARIARLLDEYGEQFTQRVFTEHERTWCDSARRRRAERYAARFAAKEAVLKALGSGLRHGISWTDIEVHRLPSGRPVIQLSGRCAEMATEMRITEWHISLSHTDSDAMASAIAWSE